MTRDTCRSILSRCKIGIAGAGGLGSNCAATLARAGVGTLVIADFDRVSEANLDRQFYFRDQVGMSKVDALGENLSRIDPGVRVELHDARLDRDNIPVVFAGCDVLIEAVDAADTKAMLIEVYSAAHPRVPIVAASGIAGCDSLEGGIYGGLRVYGGGRLFIVGDLESEVGEDDPPMAPRVGIAACTQADIAVSLILGSSGKRTRVDHRSMGG